MASYTEFEDQFLVACVLVAEETGDDTVNIDLVMRRFNISAPDYHVNRAVVGLFERKYTRHSPWVGDFTQRNIEMSALGIREAERLVKFGTEVSDRTIDRAGQIALSEVNRDNLLRLSDALDGISEELRNNEISTELGDQREIIEGDVEASKVIISKRRFKIYNLRAILLPALRFLLDKFTSGAIVELAKQAMAALLGLG